MPDDDPKMPDMTYDDVFDAMVGFFAYDTGCISSGIHDEVLKRRVREFLKEENRKPENSLRYYPKFLDAGVAEEFLSEEARKQEFGIEDVKQFINWIDDEMRG